MNLAILERLPNSRLKALLEHPVGIKDPREPWRVVTRFRRCCCRWSARERMRILILSLLISRTAMAEAGSTLVVDAGIEAAQVRPGPA